MMTPLFKADMVTLTTPVHLELVRVSAGPFLMGSDPVLDDQAYLNEKPQCKVNLVEFYIGKYPITNAQYAASPLPSDYRYARYWENMRIPSGKEEHPVDDISWYDALSFCNWLSQETDWHFTLRSEMEREIQHVAPMVISIHGDTIHP